MLEMSASMAATLKGQQTSEREGVLALTGLAGMADHEEEPNVGQTIDAAAAGFPSSVLPSGARLFCLPPPESMLAFKSENAVHLKGREIIRRFKNEGWCIGRVLKPATDATVKDSKRVANFRVFYESDDELLNQSLYGNSYARDASSAVGTWMVIASRAPQSADVPALAGPVLDRLALMPPNSS